MHSYMLYIQEKTTSCPVRLMEFLTITRPLVSEHAIPVIAGAALVRMVYFSLLMSRYLYSL